jgi:hypothetical protein
MRHGAAKRRLAARAFRIRVDPLPVLGQRRELVDALLIHLDEVVGDSYLSIDVLLQSGDAWDDESTHLAFPVRYVCG